MEFKLFTIFNSRMTKILTNDILFGRSLIGRICILKSVTGSLQKWIDIGGSELEKMFLSDALALNCQRGHP